MVNRSMPFSFIRPSLKEEDLMVYIIQEVIARGGEIKDIKKAQQKLYQLERSKENG